MKIERKDPFYGDMPRIVQIFDPTLIRNTEETNWAIGRLIESSHLDSMEDAQAYLDSLIRKGEQPVFKPETPREEAQALVFKAIREKKAKKKIELARRALEIFPDCADAYVLLAQNEAADVATAAEYYQKGMAAGERALGEEFFKEEIGHFWSIAASRGYMRARAGLALCLWGLGERESAISHLTDLLRLNPKDNQGVRDFLICWFVEMDKQKEMEWLIDKFEGDRSAFFLYSRALQAFQRNGDVTRSRKFLVRAVNGNPFVPRFLLGKRKIPEALPEHIGFGDENEAEAYVIFAHFAWENTPGARAWIEECVEFSMLEDFVCRVKKNW